jgi:SAM-dependent methyltransferase
LWCWPVIPMPRANTLCGDGFLLATARCRTGIRGRSEGEGFLLVRNDHFSRIADRYAAHRPGYPPALVDHLADIVPGTALVWEAGCGSGQLSVLLAERFERVIATDASAEQLAKARAHARVEYRREPAEACSLVDGVADLAVAAQAAHWFEIEAYYEEVRRVVRRTGIVALAVYGNVRVSAEIDAIIGRFYATALREHWPAERRYVEDGYASLPFPFEPIESPPFEMRAEWALAELLGYIDTWSAVRRLEAAGGGAALGALGAEIAEVWRDAEWRRTVRWPLTVRAGRV